MAMERRKEKRKKFTYYMRVVDANTLKPIGYLNEISTIGIQVESDEPLPVGLDYTLRMELTAEVANKSYMTFSGRSKWCRADRLTPNQYYIGFEVDITAPDDAEIFNRMIEKYGTESGK